MRSLSEKTLVQKLDKILRKQFDTNLSFKEFSAGYGIADLVFAPEFSFTKKQFNKKTPITNFLGLKILFSLQNDREYTKEDILSIGSGIDKVAILKQLSLLIKANYIEKTTADKYIKVVDKNSFNPIKKVIAIEVKLIDHKNGLMQAKRYQYFADESYLAILKEAEKNINIEEFNNHNIGLILFDTKENKIEIRHPKNAGTFEDRINSYAKELMSEKFLSLTS